MSDLHHSNPTRLAFNLTKFKTRARRESRKHSWNLPFFLGGSSSPKRASTTGDLESGERNRETNLRNVISAPQTSRHNQEPTFASQSTGSPTLMDSADEATVRRRTANSEKDLAPEPTRREEKEEKKEDKVRFGFIRHVEPKEPYTVANQLRHTLLNSWVNILLIAVPAGFAVSYAGVDGRIVFGVNFIAIIPLAALLSYGTEEVALRTGETIGGLINATFG